MHKLIRFSGYLFGISLMLIVSDAIAASGTTFGAIASNVKSGFENIGLMITGGSYIGGLAFAIGAIMKFKQHKDNPQQVTLGTPMGLLFVAAALFFLPSIMGTIGKSTFGTATTAGASGSPVGSSGS